MKTILPPNNPGSSYEKRYFLRIKYIKRFFFAMRPGNIVEKGQKIVFA